jgi:hypothetical protein
METSAVRACMLPVAYRGGGRRVGSSRVGRVVGGNSMRKMVYVATAAVLATIVVAVQRS